MNISPVGVMPRVYSTPLKSKTVEQPQQGQETQVSFTGLKTAVLGGVAAGAVAAYYLSAAIMLPPLVNNEVNNRFLRDFEYKAAMASAEESDLDKNELVEQILSQLNQDPNSALAKGYLGLADEYDIPTDEQVEQIKDSVSEALGDETLNKNSKEFYQDYLSSQE